MGRSLVLEGFAVVVPRGIKIGDEILDYMIHDYFGILRGAKVADLGDIRVTVERIDIPTPEECTEELCYACERYVDDRCTELWLDSTGKELSLLGERPPDAIRFGPNPRFGCVCWKEAGGHDWVPHSEKDGVLQCRICGKEIARWRYDMLPRDCPGPPQHDWEFSMLKHDWYIPHSDKEEGVWLCRTCGEEIPRWYDFVSERGCLGKSPPHDWVLGASDFYTCTHCGRTSWDCADDTRCSAGI